MEIENILDDIIAESKLSDYISPSEIATVFSNGDELKTRTKSPKKQTSQQNGKSLTPRINTVYCHIQRDLKSPSTNMRMRALKSLQSTTKSTHTEDDGISTEHDSEINIIDKRPSIQEVMKDIVVYVDVRTRDENRSAGVGKVIEALGARVSKRLGRNTTHVVFKDGLLSTFKKARSLNIPIVSILWIEACKNERRICNPTDYPISNLDRYEYPELYEKFKPCRNMQLAFECNKRVRAKKSKDSSPKSTKHSQAVKVNQSDITRFFRPHGNHSQIYNNTSTPVRTPKGKVIVDSPATILLNRMSSNSYTPIANIKKMKSAAKQLSVLQKNESTPLNSRRKSMENKINTTANSIAQMSICQTPQANERNSGTQTRKSTLRSQRKTIVPQKSPSPSPATPNAEQEHKTKRAKSIVLMTEHIVIRGGKNLKGFNVQSSVSRRTTYSCKPMDITVTAQSQTPANVPPQNNKNVAEIECTPPTGTLNNDLKKQDSSQRLTMATPSSVSIGRRRTLFDLSMDIISHQVQNLNSITRRSIAPPPIAAELTPISVSNSNKCNEHDAASTKAGVAVEIDNGAATLNEQNDKSSTVDSNEVAGDAAVTAVIVEKKKRKLFKPIESSPFTPQAAPLSTAVSVPSSRKSLSIMSTPKVAVKRRRTLMPKTPTVPLVNAESDFVADITPCVTALSVSKQKLTETETQARRSTLDFETIQTIKSKESAMKLPEQNTQTEKENNLNLSNVRENVGDGKLTAKKRLPYLAFTNMHKEQVGVINEAVAKLGKFKVDRTVCGFTTHMVSLEARRTMNLLRGLVRGLWILDYKWVVDSVNAGYWLSEEPYELKDFSRAVEICRAERQAFGSNYKCELFADLGAFFISPRCDNVPIRELKELIRLCSGKIEDQRLNAKYILSSCTKAYDDKIYVTPLWILDSITQMQLMRIQKYSAMSVLPTTQNISNTRNMPTAIEFKEPQRFPTLERSCSKSHSKSPSKIVVDTSLSAIYSRT